MGLFKTTGVEIFITNYVLLRASFCSLSTCWVAREMCPREKENQPESLNLPQQSYRVDMVRQGEKMEEREQKGKKQRRLVFKDVKLICSSCYYSQ